MWGAPQSPGALLELAACWRSPSAAKSVRRISVRWPSLWVAESEGEQPSSGPPGRWESAPRRRRGRAVQPPGRGAMGAGNIREDLGFGVQPSPAVETSRRLDGKAPAPPGVVGEGHGSGWGSLRRRGRWGTVKRGKLGSEVDEGWVEDSLGWGEGVFWPGGLPRLSGIATFCINLRRPTSSSAGGAGPVAPGGGEVVVGRGLGGAKCSGGKQGVGGGTKNRSAAKTSRRPFVAAHKISGEQGVAGIYLFPDDFWGALSAAVASPQGWCRPASHFAQAGVEVLDQRRFPAPEAGGIRDPTTNERDHPSPATGEGFRQRGHSRRGSRPGGRFGRLEGFSCRNGKNAL